MSRDFFRDSFDRILLIKPSSLGDVIHGLPVLHRLHECRPASRIDWLISASLAPLLKGHSQIHELIPFDRVRFRRVGRSLPVTRDFVNFVRQLRQRHYDAVVDLQGLFRTGFLSRATGAPIRIGPCDAREGSRVFYTHCFPAPHRSAHAVERNLAAVNLFGIEPRSPRFDLELSESERSGAQAFLETEGLDPRRPWAAVLPGARWETKVWPENRFALLSDRLREAYDVQSILLGSVADGESCARICDRCRHRPANAAGKTDLRRLAAIIAGADVVVGHDSAGIHLAVAFDRPLICLAGPTDTRRTGPYGRPTDIMRLDLECAPCGHRTLSQCRFGHRCMEDLPVARVVEAVHDRLRGDRLRNEEAPPDFGDRLAVEVR